MSAFLRPQQALPVPVEPFAEAGLDVLPPEPRARIATAVGNHDDTINLVLGQTGQTIVSTARADDHHRRDGRTFAATRRIGLAGFERAGQGLIAHSRRELGAIAAARELAGIERTGWQRLAAHHRWELGSIAAARKLAGIERTGWQRLAVHHRRQLRATLWRQRLGRTDRRQLRSLGAGPILQ